jgi:hypothetical protein
MPIASATPLPLVSQPKAGTAGLRHGLFLILMITGLICIDIHSQAQWGRRFGDQRDERAGVPDWDLDESYKEDVFTFVRIQFRSWSDGYGRYRQKWSIDMPESDLNLSLKVDPDGKYVSLTDPKLFDYPFVYLIEPGEMMLQEDERQAMRKYLLGGGFMMIDDFWGVDEYENLRRELKLVFPDREPQELPIEHPIFSFVFPLKEKPQIPNVGRGTDSQYDGITFERWDAQTPFYKGLFDDEGRLMMIICHNTDLGDGWEWEGANEYYFREFSEKKAYPLGINIVMYALTH